MTINQLIAKFVKSKRLLWLHGKKRKRRENILPLPQRKFGTINRIKQSPQGSQKLGSLNSHNSLNSSPILGIFIRATIRNGFHIRFQVTKS